MSNVVENYPNKPVTETVDHEANISNAARDLKYPTVMVDLPSRGIVYPPENPLSIGRVEMKYMTAKEEDILTTEQYIRSGIVLDRLFQSLIISNIDYDSMLLGDKTAIMLAARVYGYGPEYTAKVKTPSGGEQTVTVNLEEFKPKELDESKYTPGVNEFNFTTRGGDIIKFKLLTNGDQKSMDAAAKKYKRPDSPDHQMTVRLSHMILSINDNSDPRFIKMYIENDLMAFDSRRLRQYISEIQPDIDMTIEIIDEGTGEPFRTTPTIGLDFFWPDSRL